MIGPEQRQLGPEEQQIELLGIEVVIGKGPTGGQPPR
jgi:hypothetical protein